MALWLALSLITIGPVALRPSLTDDPQFDRFVFLSLVGAATALATERNKIGVAAAIVLAIAVLESGQLMTGGRHAAIADAIIKSIGGITGCGVVWLLQESGPTFWKVRASVTSATLVIVSVAIWYVISPGMALESLRQAVSRHDPAVQFELSDLGSQRAMIGVPGRPLATDVWGRTFSTLHMTVRSDDRIRALLVLGFERRGLSWQLTSVSQPHQRTFRSGDKEIRARRDPT